MPENIFSEDRECPLKVTASECVVAALNQRGIRWGNCCFCHVDLLCAGLSTILAKRSKFQHRYATSKFGEPLMPPAPSPGHPIPAEVGPRRAGDPAVLVAASSKIRQELGWTPRFAKVRDIIESAPGAGTKLTPKGYGD